MTVNHRSPDSHGNVNIGAGDGGDVMHADFEDMQPGGKMTLDEVSGKVDDLVRRLKGTAAVAFALLSLSSFAALGPTTRIGAVHPDTTLREVVEAGGGGGTIPAKVSDLENDLGFVDRTVTNGLASVGVLPAKVSDLTNDAGYVTASVTNGVAASLTNFYAAVSNATMTAHADTTNLVVSVTNAIEAQIAALQDSKRDKSDLAVYSVTQTENTDWTWTEENAGASFVHDGKQINLRTSELKKGNAMDIHVLTVKDVNGNVIDELNVLSTKDITIVKAQGTVLKDISLQYTNYEFQMTKTKVDLSTGEETTEGPTTVFTTELHSAQS